MKNHTIIIGERSNLSQRLKKNLENSKIISSKNFLNEKNFLNKNKKINLIINSFYPSSFLNKKINLKKFIEQSIQILERILEACKDKNINKLIYTSSSSVYNLSNINLNKDKISNRDIYSLTKLLCERVLLNYSKKNKINVVIARVFNIYGGNDNFSIVKKIVDSYIKKKPLLLINDGQAIRDFIHVDDVCKIYKILIKKKTNNICDIGNGYGYKIKDIISLIGENKFKITNQTKPEQNISIANIKFKVKNKVNLINYIYLQTGKRKKLKLKKYNFDINKFFVSKKIKGSIIYGAGNAGKQVCDLILQNNVDGVFCFVDDDPNKLGKFYRGKIIISFEELKNLSSQNKVPNVILAIPSLSNQKLKNLYQSLSKISLSINNLPLKSEVNSEVISLNDLQNSEFINIFDKKNLEIAKNFNINLKNKKILITGAGGSIGSELVIQLSKVVKKKIICLDFSEYFLFNLKNNMDLNQKKIELVLGDINDKYLIKNIIKQNNIDLIFHAAAYKHLNFLEKSPVQAIKNNILGTYNLINTVNKSTSKKVKIINISTDKAVKPTSILGLSKRISEIICQSYKFLNNRKIEVSTVRFGNVFGSRGSVINLFLEKLNKGETINLTDKKATRYFMSISEACNLVIAASQLEKKFKILILDMGDPINIKSLLNKMINLKLNFNKDFNIKINEVGLNKGEKLCEELSINKLTKKTKINRVLQVDEPLYDLKSINNLLLKIEKIVDTNDSHKIIPLIKNFLKNEI